MDGFFLAIQNARNQAEKILGKYPRVFKKGAVQVGVLALKEGIKIIEEDFNNEKLAGFIQMKTSDGQPAIVVNQNNSPRRRRFTIAHELGHYFLHNSQSLHIDDLDTADLVLYRDEKASQATHLREIEANQFAAELLMPRQRILKDVDILQKRNMGMSEIVEKLSEKYDVSQSAMAIRLNRFIKEMRV